MDENIKLKELLKEIQLDYSSSTIRALDHTISSIKDAIDNISEGISVGLDAAPGFVRDIGVPSPEKITFTFWKPKSFDVVGSYSVRSILKPHSNVDILIQMPKECFHEKDYLNHRYHAKRCLYLCVIEQHLCSSSLVRKIEWSTFQNEARKPVLILYPALDLSEPLEVFIRLIPTATSFFDISKLKLTRNNVRSVNQGSKTQATPKYNCSILEDMFLEDNAAFIKKVFIGWKDLGEALHLVKERKQPLQSFGVALWDSSGYFNLAFRMSHSAFKLRDEAAWALNCMDKCRDGRFEELFMTKVDFPTKFDHFIRD